MSYPTEKRSSFPFAAKVTLSLLVAAALLATIVPTEIITAPCSRLHHSLSSTSHHLTPWSFRGVGRARTGGVTGEKMGSNDDGDDDKKKKKERVKLEVHIMSKCPDAKDCLEKLVFPALDELGPEVVDFKMSFIGKTGYGNGGVACMHGPGECLGNMIHLCGQELYPYNHTLENQTTTFVPFSQCLIHDFGEIPERKFIESCAKEGDVDFQKINACVSDEGFGGGIELLKDSFEWSATLGVRTSCTVRLAGKRRCVRDGGKWGDCNGGSKVEDLVRDIKAEYNGEVREEVWDEDDDTYDFEGAEEEYWFEGLGYEK